MKPSSLIEITDCTLAFGEYGGAAAVLHRHHLGTVSVRSPRMRQTALATIHLRPPLANRWNGDGLMPLTLKVTLARLSQLDPGFRNFAPS